MIYCPVSIKLVQLYQDNNLANVTKIEWLYICEILLGIVFLLQASYS